ncbi:hypothetical protein FRC06_002743 [Ceratobasidium sp. 370]|nr:hypothetical protein FRC06_002743 [Ceratobasidium sp. 370]
MSIAHGFKRFGVLGGGQMGLGKRAALQFTSLFTYIISGIAYVGAVHAKLPVYIHDRSSDQIKKSLALMDKLLAKDVSKGKLESEAAKEARDRVVVVGEEGIKGFRDLDLVVEAASENVTLKLSLFKSLAKEMRPDAVLATNTSSISITKIAAAAIPEGVSPASEEGKKSAGRVVALLMPFINEAIMCLEKGVATRDDIDTTLKLGMNHPMGPLTLADFIGLDTCLAIQRVLYEGTGDSKYRPSVLLERMVDAGWLGKKSGKGFYEYDP